MNINGYRVPSWLSTPSWAGQLTKHKDSNDYYQKFDNITAM